MSTKSTELCEAETFTSGNPDSVLAGVWRQILKDLKIDNAMLYEKISMYTETLTKVPPKRRTQIRGNMRTDVHKEALTWYTFTKNLRALNVSLLTIEFECKHIRQTSNHVLITQLNDDFAVKEKDSEDSEEPSPLSAFFAEMRFKLGVDYAAFEALLDYYMVRSGMEYTTTSKNEQRAYFRKEFKASKMSWKSLIKGFVFLCVREVKISITLTYGYGMETQHKYSFVLGTLDEYESTDVKKEDYGI